MPVPAAAVRTPMGSSLSDAFGLIQAQSPRGPALEVRDSKLGGRGVFALDRIAMGQRIETCPCLKLTSAESGGVLSDYAFQGDGQNNILVLGLGSMYNHAAEPNADYHRERDGADLVYTATRDIECEDEITISYGDEWWEGRRLRPN